MFDNISPVEQLSSTYSNAPIIDVVNSQCNWPIIEFRHSGFFFSEMDQLPRPLTADDQSKNTGFSAFKIDQFLQNVCLAKHIGFYNSEVKHYHITKHIGDNFHSSKEVRIILRKKKKNSKLPSIPLLFRCEEKHTHIEAVQLF